MKITAWLAACDLLVAGALLPGCIPAAAPPSPAAHIAAGSDLQAGRYLAVVGGCNDCHTEGYRESGGQTPESDWLTGRKAGFVGPWGATYSANLRLTTHAMSEDDWVAMLRNRKDAPPMPWVNVNQIDERDARALYRYIRHLGSKGELASARLPPGETPALPYQSMVLVTSSAKGRD